MATRPLELFVPGRLCIMGEHSDWAGGYRRFNSKVVAGMCLVSGTSQGLYARATPHPNKLVLTSHDHRGNRVGPEELSMDPKELLRVANSGSHFAYIAGVAYQVAIRYHVQGLVLDNYKTDLPLKKGLSSSAAACVLAARAFNRIYDLKLSARGEMDLAYHGEITTPSQCGRMDQCCAFGARPVLMRFDGDKLDCEELTLKEPLYIVIVELAGHKDTVEILQQLNRAYPVAATPVEEDVQRFLGERNAALVGAAVDAVEAGDAPKLGALLDQFQAEFDEALIPQCPSQLTAPNLHRVLSYAPLRKHIWGAKGIGSQGDGCAQLLCKSAADMEAAMAVVTSELQMGCLPLQIGATRPVTQAVIPAASFAQTLFPASKTLPPALFPVLDADGIMKPAVLVLVEQALAAGILKVVIVVDEAARSAFDDIFHRPPEPRTLQRLPQRMRDYASAINETGRRVHLVTQIEQRGLGDAILTAAHALDADAPYVIMLGDHLYKSTHRNGDSCIQQLISCFDGTSLMALRPTAEAEVSRFGCATGTWEGSRHDSRQKDGAIGAKDGGEIGAKTQTPCAGHVLNLTSIVEKPSVEFARSNLVTPSIGTGEYLSAFGLYIIADASLMLTLKDELDVCLTSSSVRHTLELTPALDKLRRDRGVRGVLLEGERFDIGGEPRSYLRTLAALAPDS